MKPPGGVMGRPKKSIEDRKFQFPVYLTTGAAAEIEKRYGSLSAALMALLVGIDTVQDAKPVPQPVAKVPAPNETVNPAKMRTCGTCIRNDRDFDPKCRGCRMLNGLRGDG